MSDVQRRNDALERGELKNTGYEIFMAALSVLSIVNLVLLYVVREAALDAVLYSINILLTLIFLSDFLYRFFTVESKQHYFFRNFGWADLLASLPFQQVKILRLFRLVKVVRLLEDKGAKGIARALLRDRAGSALLSLLLIAILMLEFGSLLMLKIESTVPGANITTASDAIWYIIVTMSTVGYGDQYPITNAGRVLGTVIIIIGVGIFGTLTGYLANLFLAPRRAAAEQAGEPGQPEQPTVQTRLTELKELITQQQAAVAELEAMLDEK
jgi:voltage-gated potassium channel